MSNVIEIGDVGGLGGMTKADFRALLASASRDEELVLLVDSAGGSVFDGLAMYDELKAYDGPTRAVITAGFSIASFIPLACDVVEINPNGYMMIHNPMVSADGDAEELASASELLGKLKETMLAAYVERTGKPADEIREMMKAETYFNAQEALAIGLVDSITESRRPSAIQESKALRLPQYVFASLRGGEELSKNEEIEMADKPAAATIGEIKSTCPRAKSDFILRCLERQLPIAQVTAEYTEEQAKAMEELQAENEELKAKVAAMEEEMAKAKAEEEEEMAKAQEEEEQMAKARSGVNPVARISTAAIKSSATEKWRTAVAQFRQAGRSNADAVKAANRQYPGLRDQYLAEVNGR